MLSKLKPHLQLHKLILIGVIVVAAVIVGTSSYLPQISAQEADQPATTETPPTPLPPDTVFEKEGETANIQRLRTEYRAELEAYRRLEQLYEVAKGQNEKLQTLASLEDLVRSTQEAMQARNQVLRTYFELLRLRLQEQPGIDLELKEKATDDVVKVIRLLESYKESLTPTLDKPQIQEIAAIFADDIVFIEDKGYEAISLLALGELQTIHDKTEKLTEDMKLQIATEGGALKASQRQRAFDETDRLLASIKTEVSATELQLSNPNTQPYRSLYILAVDSLDSVSDQLAQSLSYLQELLNL